MEIDTIQLFPSKLRNTFLRVSVALNMEIEKFNEKFDETRQLSTQIRLSIRFTQTQQSIPEKKVKSFIAGDNLMQSKWIPATVTENTGPVSYVVSLADDSTMRRHNDAAPS